MKKKYKIIKGKLGNVEKFYDNEVSMSIFPLLNLKIAKFVAEK